MQKNLQTASESRVGLTDLLADSVIHLCPHGDGSVTPCCGRSPFELPLSDRLTLDQALVTCQWYLRDEAGIDSVYAAWPRIVRTNGI